MAVPVFVGAGSGSFVTTGTGTVSKTGCTAGNLIMVQLVSGGTAEDWSFPSNTVNINRVDGTGPSMDGVLTSMSVGNPFVYTQAIFGGRAIADGTCSSDFVCGASGNDLFARMYEFTGASKGTTRLTVWEQDLKTPDPMDFNNGTSATLSTINDMTTEGQDRLGLLFCAMAKNQAIGDMTGESSGVDFTEAVAEYQESGGVTVTLQLQTSTIAQPTANINTGTTSVTSVAWCVSYTSIIPATALQVPLFHPPRHFGPF